jgi:hypothetical protein
MRPAILTQLVFLVGRANSAGESEPSRIQYSTEFDRERTGMAGVWLD